MWQQPVSQPARLSWYLLLVPRTSYEVRGTTYEVRTTLYEYAVMLVSGSATTFGSYRSTKYLVHVYLVQVLCTCTHGQKSNMYTYEYTVVISVVEFSTSLILAWSICVYSYILGSNFNLTHTSTSAVRVPFTPVLRVCICTIMYPRTRYYVQVMINRPLPPPVLSCPGCVCVSWTFKILTKFTHNK